MQKTNKIFDNDNNVPSLEYYVKKLTEYINEYNTAHHGNGKLIQYYDRKVLVTYDLDDLETVYIFDADYNYICSASAKLKTPYRNNFYCQYKV